MRGISLIPLMRPKHAIFSSTSKNEPELIAKVPILIGYSRAEASLGERNTLEAKFRGISLMPLTYGSKAHAVEARKYKTDARAA